MVPNCYEPTRDFLVHTFQIELNTDGLVPVTVVILTVSVAYAFFYTFIQQACIHSDNNWSKVTVHTFINATKISNIVLLDCFSPK